MKPLIIGFLVLVVYDRKANCSVGWKDIFFIRYFLTLKPITLPLTVIAIVNEYISF